MIYNTCHTVNQFQDPKFSVSMIYLKLMKHTHFSEVVKNQQRHINEDMDMKNTAPILQTPPWPNDETLFS